MNIELLGFILNTAGTIMITYTAIAVHHYVWKEHKIDSAVFGAIKREQIIGVLEILCGRFYKSLTDQYHKIRKFFLEQRPSPLLLLRLK